MIVRYAVVSESGQRIATLDARDGAVDSAPDVIAYVRTLPLYEAIVLLGARRLHLVMEELWISVNG